MLAASGGYFEVYGAGQKAVVDTLTQPIKDKPFDITQWLAIKLVPGGHPSHATAEAAVNAARQANVSIDQIANIYIARPGGITRVDTAAPRDWVKRFTARIHDRVRHGGQGLCLCPRHGPENPPARDCPGDEAHRTGSQSAGCQIPVQLGRHDHGRDQIRSAFHQHGGGTAGLGTAGIEWSDIEAKYNALMPGSKLSKSKIDESLKVIRAYDQVKNASELTNLLKA